MRNAFILFDILTTCTDACTLNPMPLTLYRRHLKSCHVHKLNLPARAVRKYAKCECPIWIYGSIGSKKCPRQSTKQTDWSAAEAFRSSLDAEGKDTAVHGPRLGDCVAQYIASREHELRGNTVQQYWLHLGNFRKFCEERGVFFAREVGVDIVEDFKAKLSVGSRTIGVAKVRCFLRDALRRGWTTEGLAERVRPYNVEVEQKSPFTDDEVRRIFESADKVKPGTGFRRAPATFRLLLELMLATGMRAGDAVRFDPSRAERGESGVWIYLYEPQKQQRMKRQKTIEAFIPDGLKTAIDGCTWLGPLPFSYAKSAYKWHLAQKVRINMLAIGRASTPPVLDCRPHRLRDTFAVRCLLRGIYLDDVSRLLGHSSVKVTETYYARWVPARSRRLESVVAKALVNAGSDTGGN